MSEQAKSRGESGVCFGSHRLDLVSGQLWRGKQEVKVAGKIFAVLRYFVEHPGQLVSKDDLFAAVWPDTVVSDATLASCIQDLRQSLGDKAKKPRYIETVHGRGYRFVASVAAVVAPVSSSEFQVPSQEEESQTANGNSSLESSVQSLASENYPPALQLDQPLHPPVLPTPVRAGLRRKLVWVSAVLFLGVSVTVLYLALFRNPQSAIRNQEALPLPDKPSIIVLPLVNLSNDPEQEYFSDGLTEVLTGDLSKISSLFVIARNSAFTYKGKAVKVQDVSKEMGVRYVLEGSVQKANQRIRIAVQLIDATTGYHVWSEQYDRSLKDLFVLQDEIVQKIVTTLKLQLTLEEEGIIVRKNTDNLEAYDAYLRGMEYYWRLTKEANAQARQQFEKALTLDPRYAAAYAVLGITYWTEWLLRWSADPQSLERAFTLAQQALTLDDSLPTAHAALCNVYMLKQQYDQAIAEAERAIALNPNFADNYAELSMALTFAGRSEDALRAVEQARRLNPHSPPWYLFFSGIAYRFTGQYAKAIPVLKEVISRNPNDVAAHNNLAASYWLQWASQQSPAGQTLEPAVGIMQQALALNDSWFWVHIFSGYLSLYQQQYDQALTEMERAVALAPTVAESYAALAEVLSCMGRTADALNAAAQAQHQKNEFADDHIASIGTAYTIAGRYEEARPLLLRSLSRYPNILRIHLTLATVYSELGQDAEARAEVAEVLRLNPQFSLEVHKQRTPIKDPTVLERHIAALRKAGLK